MARRNASPITEALNDNDFHSASWANQSPLFSSVSCVTSKKHLQARTIKALPAPRTKRLGFVDQWLVFAWLVVNVGHLESRANQEVITLRISRLVSRLWSVQVCV